MVDNERKFISDAEWPEYYEKRKPSSNETSLHATLETLRTADFPPYENEASSEEIKEALRTQGVPAELVNQLEIKKIPKNKELGYGYSFHCGKLAKHYQESPLVVANTLKGIFETTPIHHQVKVDAVNGFINFELDKDSYANKVVRQVFERGDYYGAENIGQGQLVVIDMSSPNVAKRMHVAHLRSTIIGESLSRIFTFTGHEVTKDNHIGDWGTQFGHILYALELWGEDFAQELQNSPVETLQKLYVEITRKGAIENYLPEGALDGVKPESNEPFPKSEDVIPADKKAQAIVNEGRRRFLALEQGDKSSRDTWQKIVEWSMAEYQKIYDILGIKFDLVRGESFYEPMMESALQTLTELGVSEISEGAQIVDFTKDEKTKHLGVVIVKGSDGTTKYVTRDIATAINRVEELKADQMIYVVGGDQVGYFKSFFAILEKMGLDIVDKTKHVWFGMVTLPEGNMSTRKGNVVLLGDVISEAMVKVEELIMNRSGIEDEAERKNTIRQIALGALIWQDLSSDPKNNIVFTWEKAVTLEGNSGPYVQYMNARTRSVLSKAQQELGIEVTGEEHVTVTNSEELDLVELVAEFPLWVKVAMEEYNPSKIATYAYKLAQTYSKFYANRDNKIIDPNNLERTKSRLALTKAVNICLENALMLLGIEAPQRM